MNSNSIAFWRKLRGKTQFDIEQETGIDQAVLSEVESGKRSADSYVEKLASTLTVTQEDLLKPPPLVIGEESDIVIDRTADHAAPGELGEEGIVSRKRTQRRNVGRIFFMTPSQARVGIRRKRAVERTEGVWDSAEVYVEVPCEPEHGKVLLAKAYAADLADQFLQEEERKIEAEYKAIFQGHTGSSEFDGEKSGFPEDFGQTGEGLSGPDAPSDGST